MEHFNILLFVLLYAALDLLRGAVGVSNTPTKNTPPHIIFIYADDLGWNDISYHGSPQIPTPNIDSLAMAGIVLRNYYGQWMCTPSRASLLTGKNAILLGLQHFVIRVGEASGLPLKEKTMPQHLKKLEYKTHMIGKWHLGYQNKEYTPVYRGFDSFLGYYNGLLDYYDYVTYDNTSLPYTECFVGVDLHDDVKGDLKTVMNLRGRFSPDLFTERAEDIIENHDVSKPLFLYFAHQAVHFGVEAMPFEAPPALIRRVKHIKDVDRRVHAAKAIALDDSVGIVFNKLIDKGMLNNTIFVFASDNGGELVRGEGASSNFPLRGKKATLWEGGVHLPAFIWSPLFNLREPRISNQLMHVTDWLPTFYKAAGGDLKDLGDIDGIDMWEALTKGLPSPRKEVLYNIDTVLGASALKVGDMKVINGSTGWNSWYSPTTNCFEKNQRHKNCHFEKECLVRSWLKKSGKWLIKNDQQEHQWRKKVAVVCGKPPYKSGGNCKPGEKPCLFNIAEDPCEHHNIADKHPEMVKSLMERINEYKKTAVPSQSKPSDPKANPQCHGYRHIPWLDKEHFNECKEYT